MFRARRMAVALALLAAGAAIGSVGRGPASADGGCDPSLVHGVYGLIGGGVFFGSPEASVGTVTFDGDGHFTGTHVDAAAGTISDSVMEGGTYSIEPNCGGTATFLHRHSQRAGESHLDDPLEEHDLSLAVIAGGDRVAWLLVDTRPPGGTPGAPEPDLVLSGTFERSTR